MQSKTKSTVNMLKKKEVDSEKKSSITAEKKSALVHQKKPIIIKMKVYVGITPPSDSPPEPEDNFDWVEHPWQDVVEYVKENELYDSFEDLQTFINIINKLK